MKYFSFLICFHDGHTDIFLSGVPIGVIRNGEFKIHQVKTPSGNLRDTTMRDLQNLVVGGCPYETMEELVQAVTVAVASMKSIELPVLKPDVISAAGPDEPKSEWDADSYSLNAYINGSTPPPAVGRITPTSYGNGFPTEPGFYWCREVGRPAQVVIVTRKGYEVEIRCLNDENKPQNALLTGNDSTRQFLGPIAEPESNHSTESVFWTGGQFRKHIPSRQTVRLVEHFNIGEGWICETRDGKQFTATYSELEPLPKE